MYRTTITFLHRGSNPHAWRVELKAIFHLESNQDGDLCCALHGGGAFRNDCYDPGGGVGGDVEVCPWHLYLQCAESILTPRLDHAQIILTPRLDHAQIANGERLTHS